jgi:hypothetical protein
MTIPTRQRTTSLIQLEGDGAMTTSLLASAAPDLLAALKEMAAHAEIGIINRPALQRAYDAIAKATHRTTEAEAASHD